DALDRHLERAWVDAARAVTELAPDLAAHDTRELVVAELGDLADQLDADGVQPLLGLRPDSRQQPDRERRQELGLAPRANDGEAGGLLAVGRAFGDALRGREAERAREVRARADDGPNGLGDGACVVEPADDALQVEIALVDSRLLDRRDDLPHG